MPNDAETPARSRPPAAAGTPQPGLLAGILAIAAGLAGFSVPVLGMVASAAGLWLGVVGIRAGRAGGCRAAVTCGAIGLVLSAASFLLWPFAMVFSSYR